MTTEQRTVEYSEVGLQTFLSCLLACPLLTWSARSSPGEGRQHRGDLRGGGGGGRQDRAGGGGRGGGGGGGVLVVVVVVWWW